MVLQDGVRSRTMREDSFKLRHSLAAQPEERDVSLDYLRAFATVLVLVIHTTAPYTLMAQRAEPILWHSPIPIIDGVHSSVLDYVLLLLDASTMSLMFFISGLFTCQALRRKGSIAFLKGRAVRLGLPFLAMTLVWMPVAYYAPWSLEHPGGSFAGFLAIDARGRFSSGPGWFLWLLLFFDCATAGLYMASGGLVERAAPRLRALGKRQEAWALVMMLAGILFYVPLALRYAGAWTAFITAPFMLQPARVLLYAAWLMAGFLVGSTGLEQGLLGRQGPLARKWALWVLFGFSAYNGLWFGLRTYRVQALQPLQQGIVASLLWVLADVGICFGLLALFRGCVSKRRAWADSLARHAYAIYALHYAFAMWLERWLLPVRWPAMAKFFSAFAGTLMLSWAAAIVWISIWTRIEAIDWTPARRGGHLGAAVSAAVVEPVDAKLGREA